MRKIQQLKFITLNFKQTSAMLGALSACENIPKTQARPKLQNPNENAAQQSRSNESNENKIQNENQKPLSTVSLKSEPAPTQKNRRVLGEKENNLESVPAQRQRKEQNGQKDGVENQQSGNEEKEEAERKNEKSETKIIIEANGNNRMTEGVEYDIDHLSLTLAKRLLMKKQQRGENENEDLRQDQRSLEELFFHFKQELYRQIQVREDVLGTKLDYSKPISFNELQNPLLGTKQGDRLQHRMIAKNIKIDAKLLNFGQFFSGRALGSTVIVKNCNSVQRRLCISLNRSQSFSFQQITKHCQDIPRGILEDFPIKLLDLSSEFESGNVFNSDMKFDCWFIQEPRTKALVKSYQFSLAPRESKQIVIVHRSPSVKTQEKLITFMNIHYLPFQGSAIVGTREVIDIMLMGKIDSPKLVCPKVLKDTPSGVRLIKLALKPNMHLQKFKIPLKNLSDLEYDLQFQYLTPENVDSAYGFEFSFLQNQMKMLPNSLVILTLVVKNTNVSPAGMPLAGKTQPTLPGQNLRMLVARVKDSSMLFTYMIDSYVIPAPL